jgi:hypothetical protein
MVFTCSFFLFFIILPIYSTFLFSILPSIYCNFLLLPALHLLHISISSTLLSIYLHLSLLNSALRLLHVSLLKFRELYAEEAAAIFSYFFCLFSCLTLFMCISNY